MGLRYKTSLKFTKNVGNPILVFLVFAIYGHSMTYSLKSENILPHEARYYGRYCGHHEQPFCCSMLPLCFDNTPSTKIKWFNILIL